MPKADLALLSFPDCDAFDAWLAAQPDDAPGAWLRFAKKGAPDPTVSKSDAIDCALAHGWIDGQIGSIDAQSFKARFKPRRVASAWSQINCERVERLRAAGRMTARGEAQVALAMADGRWRAAYPPQARAAPDSDFQAALDASPSAKAFFDALDAANRYAALYRIQQTKTAEKRAAKIAEIVARMARGEAFHPVRERRAKP